MIQTIKIPALETATNISLWGHKYNITILEYSYSLSPAPITYSASGVPVWSVDDSLIPITNIIISKRCKLLNIINIRIFTRYHMYDYTIDIASPNFSGFQNSLSELLTKINDNERGLDNVSTLSV